MLETSAPCVCPQAEVARPLVPSRARIDPLNKAERSRLQMAPPGLASDLQQLAPPSVVFAAGTDGSTVDLSPGSVHLKPLSRRLFHPINIVRTSQCPLCISPLV